MNESGLETPEMMWDILGMDQKEYFDRVQELLNQDPAYLKWLQEIDEAQNEQ